MRLRTCFSWNRLARCHLLFLKNFRNQSFSGSTLHASGSRNQPGRSASQGNWNLSKSLKNTFWCFRQWKSFAYILDLGKPLINCTFLWKTLGQIFATLRSNEKHRVACCVWTVFEIYPVLFSVSVKRLTALKVATQYSTSENRREYNTLLC